MSILLEALKKSEEQRQLGQAPNIHSPGAGSAPPGDGNGHWLGLGLMGLAAVAMAWIGWQQLRQPTDLPQEPAIAQVDEVPPTEPLEGAGESAGASEPAQPAAADTASEAAPATAVRRPQMISAGASRTPVESYKADTGKLQGVTVPPPDDFQDSERQRAEVSRSVRDFKAADSASDKRAAVENVSSADETQGAQQPSPSAGEPARETVGQPQQAAEPARGSEPISFWELPQGVRDALPELRITVLVYAERPEDRFVLIGGQRIVENDRLGDGVQLAEIRRDGAVFEYRNYRFLVEG